MGLKPRGRGADRAGRLGRLSAAIGAHIHHTVPARALGGLERRLCAAKEAGKAGVHLAVGGNTDSHRRADWKAVHESRRLLKLLTQAIGLLDGNCAIDTREDHRKLLAAEAESRD